MVRRRARGISGPRIPTRSEQNSARSGSPPRSLIRYASADRSASRVLIRMSMLRLYTRVLELLGKEARLGWILAVANLLLAAAQFAEPVLFGKIVDVLSGKPQTGPLASNSAWPLLAAWVAFGLFTIAVQRAGRAPRRQAGAPPAPGGADRLFRAHHATAADLPYRHPFRPADEGDAERHRLAVAALARILPRAFCRDPVAGGAAAAGALHQLAAGDPACSRCAWYSRC